MFNTYFLPFCIIFILYQFKSWYFLLFSHQVVSNSFATPWTIAHQASLSMGFPRQGYWSGLTFLPRDWTHVFCIDRQILYHWATWETHKKLSHVWLFCHPMDCPGSSVHGISEARLLEWVAISFSIKSIRKGQKRHSSSHITFLCGFN